ncbi:UDP-glucose/GDP-mannose dehydrogenase family protein [Pigmentiphaga sp.]|uniref:UDP-glucose dehydrogenase family protein n=1 Tax=Pigmentiphaga sp. TaxID=1977564 RepID=UPI00128DDE26|nr:UDP-glucose/GDP-mannose dehydrogenase family protein [Pigmentiphaga sp.]MPS26287.1 UDP-glucose/GDP-mannose dehydrogenase family protein [Alcaligenaceae bacterium SAGV5]MPS54878.1 UDP-glucose/GDP-mannose dehydrogenase family protein [Alcaligenaceae bacterium SAGV3]MPT56336.1 UDP-glucose/GDP-mannose dehydrogenase family protein [Alcaligenaceae bacterium]
MNLAIIGAGYVGLVTGACLADVGNRVVCVERDAQRLRILRDGGVPFFEPGLAELAAHNAQAGRLAFTDDLPAALRDAEIVFIAVGTPAGEDGSADLGHVLDASAALGRSISRDMVVVIKSTVPVGTCHRVQALLEETLRGRGVAWRVSIASNPEFLKEGSAVDDFQRPDRIVIGTEDPRALRLMAALYSPYNRNRDRLIHTDVRSAEFTKYASNVMLATRISLMNELARIAEKVGADIEAVRHGTGADPRIGHHFLYAGVGYGGSCFPKDIQALARLAADHGESTPLLNSVQRVNEEQKRVMAAKIRQHLGPSLQGRCIALWGLAFKPNTDDIREAPSIALVRELVADGATVRAYDPAAADNARRAIDHPGLVIVPSAQAACEGADVLAVVTEWREFKSPDFRGLAGQLKSRAIFDGRNLYDPEYVESCGLSYYGIGRGSRPARASQEGVDTPAVTTGYW